MGRWETEYAPFYKKGITALDRIKLLESFVLHMYDKMLPFQEVSPLSNKAIQLFYPNKPYSLIF